MPNPGLRALLAEFSHARASNSAAAVEAILARYGPALRSDEADAELSAWIEETRPGDPVAAAGLETARQTLRVWRTGHDEEQRDEELFEAFKQAADGLQLARLAQRLLPVDVDALLRVAEARLAVAEGRTAAAIRGRLAALRPIREALARMSPLDRGLAEFLQAETDAAARAVLLARPELLLSDASGNRLRSYVDADPAGQAHLDARRALWREVQVSRGPFAGE